MTVQAFFSCSLLKCNRREYRHEKHKKPSQKGHAGAQVDQENAGILGDRENGRLAALRILHVRGLKDPIALAVERFIHADRFFDRYMLGCVMKPHITFKRGGAVCAGIIDLSEIFQ